MNFNKKEDQEYVDVADRIQEFKTKHPNYMIDTDIVFNEGSNVFAIKCVIKSEIGQVLASGHSMGRYDKDSDFFGGKLIETVETTAVGRALAFLGIKSTKAIASKDEIDQAKDMKSSFLLYQEQIMATLSYSGIKTSETYGIIKAIAKKKSTEVKK